MKDARVNPSEAIEIFSLLKIEIEGYTNSVYTKNLYLSSVTRSLVMLTDYLKLSSSISLTDANKLSEDFFCGLLNLIFGYNLQNLNSGKQNYPAIDLGDKDRKLSVQVTIDNSSEKIKKTLSIFDANNVGKEYQRVIVFIAGYKQKRYSVEFTSSNINFSKGDDILDLNDLVKSIAASDTKKICEIDKYLEKELVSKIQGSNIDPTRLLDEDIRDILGAISDFIENKNEKVIHNETVIVRDENFIERKNELNNISEILFNNEITPSLIYSEQVKNFLINPINKNHLAKYLSITHRIQVDYKRGMADRKIEGVEFVFRKIFEGLTGQYNNRHLDSTKILIVLHNMYFNCDIGLNP